MSDFNSDFWSLYVASLSLISILACGVLLFRMGRMRVPRKCTHAVVSLILFNIVACSEWRKCMLRSMSSRRFMIKPVFTSARTFTW